jgi:hypothetical protein
MSQGYDASYRADLSIYDARRSGKGDNLASAGCNAELLAEGRPIPTGCLGNAEWGVR